MAQLWSHHVNDGYSAAANILHMHRVVDSTACTVLLNIIPTATI